MKLTEIIELLLPAVRDVHRRLAFVRDGEDVLYMCKIVEFPFSMVSTTQGYTKLTECICIDMNDLAKYTPLMNQVNNADYLAKELRAYIEKLSKKDGYEINLSPGIQVSVYS